MTTVIIFIIFHHPLAHLELHSFPTRRSSDLPSVRNTSPRTDVRKIESTALPSGLLGIIPLSPVGPGHGAPSDSSARDRKSTRLNSSHGYISYAVFCLKKKTIKNSMHIALLTY